jgi:hypothetical protein
MRLVKYALWLVKHYRWQGQYGSWIDPGSCVLPGGVGVEDVVAGAVEKVFSGSRSWNPDAVSLYGVLAGIVRSDISTLLNSQINKREVRASALEEFARQERAPTDVLDHALAERRPPHIPEELLSATPSPSDSLLEKENKEAIVSFGGFLKDRGEPRLQQLVECIMVNKLSGPMAFAQVMGTTVKEIYNLQKRLRRKAEEFNRLRAQEELIGEGGAKL